MKRIETTPKADRERVIVVGGGLSGLTCASVIAAGGGEVLVLDAGARLGGRAASSEHDGYMLNEGAHALYASSERLLAGVGVRCSGGHPNVGAGSLLYEEQLLPAPFAPRALLGRGPLSARERAQFVGALAAAATARPARLGAQTCRTWVSEHSCERQLVS